MNHSPLVLGLELSLPLSYEVVRMQFGIGAAGRSYCWIFLQRYITDMLEILEKNTDNLT